MAEPGQSKTGPSPRLKRALEAWQKSLIDTGGRNPLLYFRDLKVGTLDLADTPIAARNRFLAGEKVKLSEFFPTPDGLENATKRATAVHKKARERFEEWGLSTLYVVHGVATWLPRTPTVEMDGSSRPANPPNAPVLLRPVELKKTGTSFELTLDDEPALNPTLLHLLQTEFGVPLRRDDLAAHLEALCEPPGDLTAIFAQLRAAVGDLPGFRIDARLVLGSFSYAKMPMVEDLGQLSEVTAGNGVLETLAGNHEAPSALAASEKLEDEAPDSMAPADEFLVLDADASQSWAINAVTHGENTVVEGPPGTGKSQTIANLIATLAARGKSVLFVAAKRAAIDAVAKYLAKAQLGELILDLHDGPGAMKKVAADLASTLKVVESALPPKVEALHRQLTERRSALNEATRALHQVRAPWNRSAFQALEGSLSGDPGSQLQYVFPPEVLQRLTPQLLNEADSILRELQRFGGFEAATSNTLWARAKLQTPDDVDRLAGAIEQARTQLDAAAELVTQTATETGLAFPIHVAAWGTFVALLKGAEQALSYFRSDIFEGDLSALCRSAAAAGRGWFSRLIAWLFDGGYRAAIRQLRAESLDETADSARLLSRVQGVAKVKAAWDGSSSATSRPVAAKQLPSLASAVSAASSTVAALESEVHSGLLNPDQSDLELQDALSRLEAELPIARKLPKVRELRRRLEALGLAGFLRALDTQDPADAARALAFAFDRSLYAHLEGRDPSIGAYEAAMRRRDVREYTELDRQHIQTGSERVRRKWAERVRDARNANRSQDITLVGEAKRQRGFMPFRRLLDSTATVMMALKPCFAMSPLVVSQVLPRKRMFDVLIFDEASQINSADAVPALARAKQVVAAGDLKQLPPTDFFTQEAADTESSDEQEAEGGSLPPASESILEGLSPKLANRQLQWHYRSRDERLIAFSNANFYDRSLHTFPSQNQSCPVTFDQVKNPKEEADMVLALVARHHRENPTDSIGVVTLGRIHADRIEAEIDRNPALAELRTADLEEPLFIKNLERVQGDERDAIILSVGYANRTMDGRLKLTFGPLNQSGGERRLNVAISRARKAMFIVSSFKPSELPQNAASTGVQLLKEYLEFAQSGGVNLGSAAIAKPALNPFERQVARRLTEAGLKFEPQHGAGRYLIDFAVRHPTQAGAFALAVECDGATYHSSSSARDRDRLRQEQLEARGWHFHRIWSTTWFRNASGEMAQLMEAYERACRAPPQVDKAAVQPLRLTSQVASPPPRRQPKPPFKPGQSIDKYIPSLLLRVVQWIQSDDVPRTDEQVLQLAMEELGFKKRGEKIVEALTRAIIQARGQVRQ